MAALNTDLADRTFLDDLSLDLTSLAAMLARYAEAEGARRRREPHDPITAGQLRTLLAARYARSKAFGVDLSNPGWSLLLELFRSELEKSPLNLARLAAEAQVARTTALRWVNDLTTAGFIRRVPDANGTTGAAIALTDAGLEAMEDYFVTLLHACGGS